MQKPPIALRKRALLIFLGALAGSLVGVVFGRVLLQQFPDAPPWLLPAIVIGAVGLVLVAVFALPVELRSRHRNKQHDNGA